MNAEWCSGTSGNPGAWATLRRSGQVLQVFGPPQVSPGDSVSLQPETAQLYSSATVVHGANNKAMMVSPFGIPAD